MIGEALKMGTTIAMFVAIAFWYHDVRWVPLLVTYLIALEDVLDRAGVALRS